MTDLASLGIQIDSTQVPKAVGDLDKLTAAGGRAEGATERLTSSTKSASAAAAQFAANAQTMARNATLTGSGLTSMGKATGLAAYQAQNLAFQLNDVATGLASGQAPMRVLAQQSGQFVQIMQQSGLGVRGFATALLEMIGILKVTRDAELAEEAANAAAAATAIKSSVDRAKANIAAADTEIELALAAQRQAVTATQAAAASERLAKAHAAQAAAAGEAAIAEDALGIAQGRAAAASEASAAATVTSVGRIGIALGVTAVVAGTLVAAFADVKRQAAEDADMQKFIGTLGLTRKEMKKLQDTTVTWGDVAKATFQVLAEKAGINASQVSKFFTNAFHTIGDFAKFSIAVILAAFGAMVKGVADLVTRLPQIVGGALTATANLVLVGVENLINNAIRGINRLADAVNGSLLGQAIQKVFGTQLPHFADVGLGRLKGSITGTMRSIGVDVSDTFHSIFNQTEATFDQISARAAKIRQDAVRAQANEIIADREGKATKAHRERAKAASEEADALERLRKALADLVNQPADIDVLKDKALSPDTPTMREAIGQIFGDAGNDHGALLAGPNALLQTLQQIQEQSQVTAQVMQDAFGNVGGVFGTLITGITDYAAAQQSLAIDVLKGNKTQEQADKALSTLRMKNTASMLGALKGLFKEHSTGYKVMTAIEKAYAIFQAVQTAIAIARDIAHTASSVTNSATRTAANTAEGGSKIFAQLGVWAFPVVAAMIALLASLGAKGGGGGGGAAIPNVDDLQAAQGAGTVLGDSKAKSESIAHSLEIVAANTNKDLEYTNEMLRTLRNIDVGISKLAGTIAQEIQVGNLFDTSGLNLGTTGSKGFLGIGAKSVTRTLADQGIVISGSPLHLASHYKNQALWNAAMAQVTGASVASILANGLYGASYTRTDEQRTSGGVLGIGGGSSTGVDYDTGPLSNTITNLFVQVIGSMRDSILAASKVVGLDGAQALIDAFQVKIGQISFEGMTGDQIEDQLNAIFSSIGDQMAGAVFPALKAMQKVGEGLLETFMRVAREYQVVDVELQSIGKTFGMTGVQSIAARDALVQLFGSVDDFVSQTDFFKEQFLSDAEQVAPIQSAVIAELQRLGVSGVTTRDQFKQLVLGLDLTTDAGRQMYASLLAVAPAFDKVLDYFDQLNKKQIETLQSTIDQFNKFTDSLKKYRDTLFAADATQGNAYNVLKSRFIATANLAATGDATALGGLQQSGQDFLTAARNNASTLQQYLRDVAMVARGVDNGIAASEDAADYAQLQLDALQNATSILQQINANTQATAAALTQPVVAQPTSAPPVVYSSTTETSVPVVEDQNARIIQQNDTIIDLLTKQQRLFTKFDGDGLLVRTDSDTPLNVVTS